MKDEPSCLDLRSCFKNVGRRRARARGLQETAEILGIVLLVLVFCASVRAAVVINEIFYHPPDDLEDLQWIELYNTGKEAVALGGWSLARSVTFAFPAGTRIEADGYLVVARKPTVFQQHYAGPAIGGFESPLKHGASHIELVNSQGQVVDVARYKDRDPWPMSPDGYSSSLERICPTASGEKAENWAPSPLPDRAPKPSGDRPGGVGLDGTAAVLRQHVGISQPGK